MSLKDMGDKLDILYPHSKHERLRKATDIDQGDLDRCAIAALQTLVDGHVYLGDIATEAYDLADAMQAEKKRRYG